MMANAARTFAVRAWLGISLFAALILCAHSAGLRVNESPSLPIGIWRVSSVERDLRKDDIVGFCPPDTPAFREARERGYVGKGLCEGGYEPLLKPIAAIAGDRLSQTEEGIKINGRVIANSKNLARDGSGRTLPSPGTNDLIVTEGEIWVVSSYNSLSFDSRYFGPVPISSIEGLARPLFVFDSLRHP
jgi:conjugative transfer signal peptidase TraF